MTWLARIFDLVLILVGIWANQKKQQQQIEEAENENKQISKWQNRPTSLADASNRLRQRAARKRAAKNIP